MNKEIQAIGASVSFYEDHFNKRIRVDDYEGDVHIVLEIIIKNTSEWVEKLIVKSRPGDLTFFLSQGFVEEAHVKGYFSGVDMYFVVKYFSDERKTSKKWEEEQLIIGGLKSLKNELTAEVPMDIQFASQKDSMELAHLYKGCFKIYPTPLNDAKYVQKTMDEGTIYMYIRDSKGIVSAASAEINRKYNNAELTDCATLKDSQGKGYMRQLILALEKRLIDDGITCMYTLARAESTAMNTVFLQMGYSYSGRLINNCFIFSGIEDMNVWWKRGREEGSLK